MTGELDVDAIIGLRGLYLKQLKERLSTLEKAMLDLKQGLTDQSNYDALEFEVHRLNGTGATYGFPDVSVTADALEAYLRSDAREPGAVIKLLDALMLAICDSLVAPSAHAPVNSVVTPPRSKSDRAACKPTVLVADDDPAILNLVMQLLSSWAKVKCVENGRAAIEAVERRRFDLVILDSELPDVSGLDVLIRMGRTRLRSQVMMLSAVRDPDRVARLIAAGADHYLVKPIAPDHLIERVAFLLNRQKKVIMIVDDDPLIREIFRKRFTQRGHEVVLAANGTEALNMARRVLPQAIVLDRQMPRLDGIQVLQKLRREEETRSIPVIMLSARNSSDEIYAGYREGADAYIVKPFVPDRVIDCCEGFLRPPDMSDHIASAKAVWKSCTFI
jgi:DNA-binding response OmpR family regulator